MGHYGSQGFTIRSEIREEASRQAYPYTPTFQGQDMNMQSESPSPTVHPHPSHPHSHRIPHRESPVPYGARRSLAEPQFSAPVNHVFPQVHSPAQAHDNTRPPDFIRQPHDNPHLPAQARQGHYGLDGSLHPLS